MRKIVKGLSIAILAASVLTGCGQKIDMEKANEVKNGAEETNTSNAADVAEGTLLKDVKVEDYVTLGAYKGLEVSVVTQSTDEDEVRSLASDAYNSVVTAELGGITDRAVANGDTVIMDYEGKRDGVAFDGGTAQGASLTIGSGRFIDGFEDGLIGVMPGETVDLNLTFPEDYFNEELAGAEVVFTVTVHYILPGVDDMKEDAVVANLGIEGVDTVEGLLDFARDYLNDQAESYNSMNIENSVLDAFIEGCTFGELPQTMLDEYRELIRSNLELEAQQYGSQYGYDFDAETYAQQMYGAESLDAFLAENAENALKEALAMQAVANLENLNMDDETLDAKILEYANQSGYDTIEEYIGDTSKENFREYFVNRAVVDYLVENANVSKVSE
jgi:trigger factor